MVSFSLIARLYVFIVAITHFGEFFGFFGFNNDFVTFDLIQIFLLLASQQITILVEL